MSSRPVRLDLTVEDVLNEIGSWPDANSKHRALDDLTEEQRKILCVLMRSGKRMLEIADYWKKNGFSGSSPGTLRRMYKELVEEGY